MKLFSSLAGKKSKSKSSKPNGTTEERPATAEDYKKTIQKTIKMSSDSKIKAMAQKHKFNIMNVTWEDTGRFKNSCVGPNITDMTLQVEGGYNLPIIRSPNYSDKTGDVDPKKFNLLIGNEKGEPLISVTLHEYLANIRDFLHDHNGLGINCKTLLAPERDSHVIVSPQACFLPIPKNGMAKFNPVLFNYQSQPGDPAVLAILVTREGTSATILGRPDDGGKLYFNDNGQKASFTGQRKSDWKKEQQTQKEKTPKEKQSPSSEPEDESGLNMVLLIQVPLKQKNDYPNLFECEEECDYVCADGDEAEDDDKKCNVEDAVIGHGEAEGEYKEMDGLDIERDDRFPVRATIQFYKATSNGVMTQKVMDEIVGELNRVYDSADCVGSLVVDGKQGRITEHSGLRVEPPNWWEKFYHRHQAAGSWLPEYLLLRRNWSDQNQWYPSNEVDAEALYQNVLKERTA